MKLLFPYVLYFDLWNILCGGSIVWHLDHVSIICFLLLTKEYSGFICTPEVAVIFLYQVLYSFFLKFGNVFHAALITGQYSKDPEGVWCFPSGIPFVLWLLEKVCGSWGSCGGNGQSRGGLWKSSAGSDIFSGHLVELLRFCHQYIWRSRHD